MRMRSALTASVLAAGILLSGAGAALADGGVDLGRFSGGHAGFASTCSSAAAVPAAFGPAYTSTCSKEREKEWADFAHLGAR
ncbi:hypothetical protein AB0P12_25460 [Streptomyces subrutilus]|uniref:Uncharacterized protein n=1 Tax=Streptomyces subrutilus TaxID=36818 RepID=A0A918UZV9_9ACTN|nr:hypothetical protein [Streptomyces subrutilus]WSJ33419.1 hypothetical protein OG479_31245 [Streptomyces subrutilus]GGZ47936.1 hypothetical protein GCM10010371_04120 [Streptomyces subrutilus]